MKPTINTRVALTYSIKEIALLHKSHMTKTFKCEKSITNTLANKRNRIIAV